MDSSDFAPSGIQDCQRTMWSVKRPANFGILRRYVCNFTGTCARLTSGDP